MLLIQKEKTMKWMVSSVAILVTAVSVAVGAQSGDTMVKGDKMDMKDTTFVGCIEGGSAPGAFTLTHVAAVDRMQKSMKEDAMGKTAMDEGRMGHDTMPPAMLSLMGSSVALRKHVGHKVSVTGWLAHEKMDAMDKDAMGKSMSTFTIKSLKMVAATCS
jgi:hypothetical protein